jgi:hypothetical protein
MMPQSRARTHNAQVGAVNRYIRVEAHRLARLRNRNPPDPTQADIEEATDSARWIMDHTLQTLQITTLNPHTNELS